MSNAGDPHVVRVAVLVTADTRPKHLSWVLDKAFEDEPEILQFVVTGTAGLTVATRPEASLWEALISDIADIPGLVEGDEEDV